MKSEELPRDHATFQVSFLYFESWYVNLENASFDQQQVQRELGYRVPGIASIEATLDSRSPANAPDLQAIVMTYLTRIASRVRDASTNDFRQYWNEDSNQNPPRPSPRQSQRRHPYPLTGGH